MTDVVSQDGQALHLEVPLELDTVKVGAECFAVSAQGPAVLDISHMDGQAFEITVSCQVSARIPCGRCLEEVEKVFSVHSSAEADLEGMEEGRVQESDEHSFITGPELDVDQWIHRELLVQWPLRVLCKEDCKGICSQCGTNLNHGTCSCEKQGLDPRMAAISDIFSKFKEV